MYSLLRKSKYLWSVTYRNTIRSNHFLRKPESCVFWTSKQNSKALRTSCCLFNEARTETTDPPLPPIEPARSLSCQLQQEMYKLDADVRRFGRLAQAEVEKVFTSMKRMGRVPSSDGLLLIHCCGSLMPEMHAAERTELVNDIWKTLPLLECNFDVSHYNAILKVYLENEHSFDPIAFLAAMEQQRVEPNRVTYQRLLSKYCQNGDIEGASKILEFMKLKDLPLNEIIFNELITGHAKAKNMQDARKTLEVMRNAQLSPNSSTYAALASGYAFLGDIENVLETMKEAEINNAFLRDKDILHIIYVLTVNQHSHLVDQVFPKLQFTSGYNQECIKTVLELVNRGFHEIAFTLLNTLSKGFLEDGSVAPAGMFFIKHIVKEDVPSNVVIDYCKKLEASGQNSFGLLKATETAFILKKPDDAIAFLKELRSEDRELRPHYFWPILLCKKGDDNDMYNVLKLMLQLDCPANFDTLTDYFFAHINTSDPCTVVNKLKDIGLEVNDTVTPLCMHILLRGEIKDAANLLTKFPVKVNPALVASRGLANAYVRTHDTSSTLKILQHSKENPELISQRQTETDVYGKFLVDLVLDQDFQVPALEDIIKEMKMQDMKISQSAFDSIHKHLGTTANPQITTILKSIVSYDVPSLYVSEPYAGQKLPTDMSIDDLEAYLIMRKSKNLRTSEVLHKLLMLHAKQKNLKRVQEIIEELEESGFVFRASAYAVLLDLFWHHGELDRALYYKKLIDTEYPEFHLDDHKVINLAQLLAVNKKYDDAENVIRDHHAKFGVGDNSNNKSIQMNIFRLLDVFASSEDIGHARKIFEMLHGFGYCRAGNVLLGPLVKAYFLRNDISGAMEEYLRIVKVYKTTPWKSELLKQLILLEDFENLQTVIDTSITVHGEANVMFDLAQVFISVGQLQQAQKVIETPGLTARMDRIEKMCDLYVEEKKVTELEIFVQLTKDVFGLDRNRMYYHLLRAHVNSEDVEKALGVWVMMQEENVHPSNQTLHLLGTFLQSKNQPVPFEIPSTSYGPIERYEPYKNTTTKISNQAEMFLKSLESHVWRHKANFPIKSLFNFLKDNPSMLNRVMKMSDMYHQEGVPKARNTVWMYLMTEKRFAEADKILKMTPELKRHLLFLDITRHLRGKNDLEISQKLLDVVKESNINNQSKGLAYSAHINVLVSLNELKEALKTLDGALRSIDIADMTRGTLFRLKDHLVSANMAVPFTIPENDRRRDGIPGTEVFK